MAGGLRLELSDGRPAAGTLDAVNAGLAPFGARVWPRGLAEIPAGVRALLARPTLAPEEAGRITAEFLLPRARLLDLIEEARGTPHVPGGGEDATTVVNHGYTYPQLFVVEAGADYTRFDRFHVNTDDDGTGVDEIMQVLAGGGIRVIQRRPGHGTATLHLDCRGDTAWTVTYDGGGSHIGSFSTAAAGTKVLMQVIGPARWTMRYDDGDGGGD